MKTSILVPCYNHENYVAQCIKSIIDQDYDDIEVIICDDASGDDSWEIINSFKDKLEQRFNRVVLKRNKCNVGLTKNLNTMLKISEGEIIKLIASDDMLVRDCISNMVNIFINNPDVSVIVTNGWIVDEKQEYPAINLRNKIYKQSPDLNEETLFERLFCKNYILAPSVGIRRRVYEELGTYDESIMIEDWEYWLRIANDKRFHFYYDDSCKILYRKSNDSMTAISNNGRLEGRRNILHEAELGIIDKYKPKVSKQLYAKRKYEILENEFLLAYKNQLEKMKLKVKNELKEFLKNERKDLTIKEQCICLCKWIRWNIGKYR